MVDLVGHEVSTHIFSNLIHDWVDAFLELLEVFGSFHHNVRDMNPVCKECFNLEMAMRQRTGHGGHHRGGQGR